MMYFVTSNFLGAFAERLWTAIVSFVMSVGLSAQNEVLPQDRYLWNFIFEIFTKIHEHLILFKIRKKKLGCFV